MKQENISQEFRFKNIEETTKSNTKSLKTF